MKRRHKQGKAAVADKPLLYNLADPEQLKAVKLLAMASGFDAALACAGGKCDCRKHHFRNHLDGPGQAYLPYFFVQKYAHLELDGRRGVSDLTQFRAIFDCIVPRVYRNFLDFLQRSPGACAALESFKGNERLAQLVRSAEAQLHVLDFPDPLPLTWPPPTHPEVA